MNSRVALRKLATTRLVVFMTTPVLWAQTEVPVLVPGSGPHDHYLFNRYWSFDGRDSASLPRMFYYVNAGLNPAPTTLRTRCALEEVNGAPYNHVNFGWYRFPAPSTQAWEPATGTEPLAATGEYLESARFGPMNGANPSGFVFDGEFAGQTNPASKADGPNTHFFVEAVYFTDRECSDGGAEYGWYRMVANSNYGDAPANSFTFYYSIFANCNTDYACWDTNGKQVNSSTVSATITDVAASSAGTYQYKFQVIRSGSNFNLSILDPNTNSPVTCKWSISTGGTSNGNCEFSVPIESWYPPAGQINTGYLVIATQSSHLYPSMTGAPYPQWYDYALGGQGAAPPKNIVPTKEPNGTKSCMTRGGAFACLDARGLAVLYQ